MRRAVRAACPARCGFGSWPTARHARASANSRPAEPQPARAARRALRQAGRVWAWPGAVGTARIRRLLLALTFQLLRRRASSSLRRRSSSSTSRSILRTVSSRSSASVSMRGSERRQRGDRAAIGDRRRQRRLLGRSGRWRASLQAPLAVEGEGPQIEAGRSLARPSAVSMTIGLDAQLAVGDLDGERARTERQLTRRQTRPAAAAATWGRPCRARPSAPLRRPCDGARPQRGELGLAELDRALALQRGDSAARARAPAGELELALSGPHAARAACCRAAAQGFQRRLEPGAAGHSTPPGRLSMRDWR